MTDIQGLPARRAALQLLDAVLRRGQPLENALNAATRGIDNPADRALAHAQVQPEALQAQQLQRDIDNVTWLVQACDEALSIFRDALARVTHVMETSPTTQQQHGSLA